MHIRNVCIIMRKYYCILISLWALSSLACLQAQDDFNVATTVSANGLRGEVQQVDIDNLVRKEYYRTDWEQRPWFTDKLREFLQEADGQIVKFDKKGLIQQTTVTSEGNKVGTVKYEYSKGRITGYEGFGTLVQAKYNGSRADVNIYGYGGVVNFKPRVTKHGTGRHAAPCVASKAPTSSYTPAANATTTTACCASRATSMWIAPWQR